MLPYALWASLALTAGFLLPGYPEGAGLHNQPRGTNNMLMNDIAKTVLAFGAIAALGALGCERRDDNDSRRIANRAEDKAERTGERVEGAAERTEERLEQAGKDLTGGVSYEVAKINKEAKTVEVRMANALPGVTDKKDLQSGKESIVFTFDELAAKVEGDKPGHEIADELHVGENISVFMDANHNIQKITY